MTQSFRLRLALVLWVGGAALDVRAVTAQSALAGFDAASPELGDLVPDIAILDQEGQPFELRSFKGSYTVLVLGCLT